MRVRDVATEIIKEGNARVAAAMSEMTRKMSGLSGAVRALLVALSGGDCLSDVQR